MSSFEAEVTFIPKSEGGRNTPPVLDQDYTYRPCIVIGDTDQRKAKMEGNFITEPYIGVAFPSLSENVEFKKAFQTELALVYPQPGYEKTLVKGATFTLREGASIVGYGAITRSIKITQT